jgi:hypothetical protein
MGILTFTLNTCLVGFGLCLANPLECCGFRVDVHHRRTIRRTRRPHLPFCPTLLCPHLSAPHVAQFPCPTPQPVTPSCADHHHPRAPALLNHPTNHTSFALRSLLVTNPGLASKLTWYFPIPVWSPPSLTASRSTPPGIGAAPRPYFSALTPIDTLVSRADRTADLRLAAGQLCRCWCGRYGLGAAGVSCLTFLRLAAIQQSRAACPRR